MKVLFIGGTGNISTSSSRLALEKGVDLYLLNRGNRLIHLPGANSLLGDISRRDTLDEMLRHKDWDVVVNWIAFTPEDVERDIELFAGKTRQYIFISSASAYQKPPTHPIITESTPLVNPYWAYSRDKIACEERLMAEHRTTGFPVTMVRPSLTYDTVIPLAFGCWDDFTMIARMRRGEPIVVPGDGTSLWTITHAEDFARGFVGLLGHPETRGQAFHITSDEALTWDQIYRYTAEGAGAKANIIHIASDYIAEFAKKRGMGWMEGNLLGDKSITALFDNSKIKRFVPGFQAVIPYREGIRRTIDWFEADPARMRIDEANNSFMNDLIAAYTRK